MNQWQYDNHWIGQSWGPLSSVGDSEHCSVYFLGLGNKAFFIDEPFEEFVVQRLDGGDDVDKQKVMNEAEELRTSEAADGKLPCEDSVTKRQTEDDILQEQLEKFWKTDFRDSCELEHKPFVDHDSREDGTVTENGRWALPGSIALAHGPAIFAE